MLVRPLCWGVSGPPGWIECGGLIFARDKAACDTVTAPFTGPGLVTGAGAVVCIPGIFICAAGSAAGPMSALAGTAVVMKLCGVGITGAISLVGTAIGILAQVPMCPV